MNDKVRQINKSIVKWEIDKNKGSLAEAVNDCSIDFRDTNQGIEVLAYAATARALGLSNRDLQPRRLSNYLRSGYLQVQLISSVILFQFRGDNGVSRDDLYDSITDVFPAVTFANFRKVLATGVDSEIFVREKDPSDSRRTLYRISEEMMEPLTNYFSSVVSDFDQLFSGVFDGALRKEDIENLQEYIVTRMTITPFKK
tara:strand:- start:11 stop:607 length:597 start_codon:yes stop_codon:yes gene_type:complete